MIQREIFKSFAKCLDHFVYISLLHNHTYLSFSRFQCYVYVAYDQVQII